MSYSLIAQGTGPSELERSLEPVETNNIGEGEMVELELNFLLRFPGFESIAQFIDDKLQHMIGVIPWEGSSQIIYVDSQAPIWRIRWRKGLVWATYIISALWAVAIIIATVALWRIFRVIPAIIDKYPWLVTVAIVGGLMMIGSTVYSATRSTNHVRQR